MIKITGQETGRVYYINPEKIASIESTDNGAVVFMDNTVQAPKIYYVRESAEELLMPKKIIAKPKEVRFDYE